MQSKIRTMKIKALKVLKWGDDFVYFSKCDGQFVDSGKLFQDTAMATTPLVLFTKCMYYLQYSLIEINKPRKMKNDKNMNELN